MVSKSLRGVAGLEALWESLQAKSDEEIDLSDLTSLNTFSMWLSAETRKSVRDLKGRLEKG
eukprot:3308553-Amphidinium_carterae.1